MKKNLKSKVYTFSARGESQEFIEKFKASLGDYSFSQAVIDGLGCLAKGKEGKSDAEVRFDEYCRRNCLSKDAQLELLMGPYRVSNSIEDDFTPTKEVNFYAAD